MPRPEQPFASFEQTLPGPMMMTALWPLADVPKRMTLVHGRYDSRCSSLGAKRQLRSEAFYPRSPSILLYNTCRIARSTAGAVARSNARFWIAFRARLTTATCKYLRIDTFAYLRDVLGGLPTHAKDRLEELLPHRWQSASQAAASTSHAPAPAP